MRATVARLGQKKPKRANSHAILSGLRGRIYGQPAKPPLPIMQERGYQAAEA